MASSRKEISFPTQIRESKRKIRDCFKRSHEALQLREGILLSRIDQIEQEYDYKTEKMSNLVETLDTNKSKISDTLTDNELKDTLEGFISLINKQISELTAQTDYIIYFDWDKQFETAIQKLGSVITLCDQNNKFKGWELKLKMNSGSNTIRKTKYPLSRVPSFSRPDPQPDDQIYKPRLHRLSLPVNFDRP
ncbi:hypothetical protein LOD99_7029 [Oopsacas minuta]|uniref:Uncharacterized protein n=1 Tax=Oopsacas minuta TaxID=111878 RepID=A0AAV7JKH4_9METZ|nr:hypothetical protein LOD99_7029 [Oopsacas minuta]